MRAGVALTFDDHFTGEWLSAQQLFSEFNAKVTFFVSHLHELDDKAINELHQLEKYGHEIGYHSRTHPKLKPYLEKYPLRRWVREEIDRGIEEHKALGFPAESFGSPFHASTAKTRRATAKRFKLVRARGPKSMREEHIDERVYKAPREDRSVDCIGSVDFQQRGHLGFEHFCKCLDAIESGGGVGFFVGHNIRKYADGAGFYASFDQMHQALEEISRRGLKFYRASEFADI